MKNKKGLSGIVTTLIIILLVIAAIAVIWPAVKSLLTSGTDDLAKSSVCLKAELKVLKVTNVSSGMYNLSVERMDSGEVPMMAQFQFIQGDDKSGLTKDANSVPFGPLERHTVEVDVLADGFTDPTALVIIPYYLSESDEEILCENAKAERPVSL